MVYAKLQVVLCGSICEASDMQACHTTPAEKFVKTEPCPDLQTLQ